MAAPPTALVAVTMMFEILLLLAESASNHGPAKMNLDK
jgi:hypothetical protein